jgi:hypothetical protein
VVGCDLLGRAEQEQKVERRVRRAFRPGHAGRISLGEGMVANRTKAQL